MERLSLPQDSHTFYSNILVERFHSETLKIITFVDVYHIESPGENVP